MPEYLRIKLEGCLYFFTVVTFDRKPILTSNRSIEILRSVIKEVQSDLPFIIEGFVLLPNHIHSIWRMPENEKDYSKRWQAIKAKFTHRYLVDDCFVEVSRSMKSKRERGVWQRRFWEHWIRDETDFFRHLDYIHWNPVKHGYVKRVRDWEWSTFHKYVKKGWYPLEWGDLEDDTKNLYIMGEQFD